MQSVGIAALFGACATLLRKTSGGPARLDAQPAWHRCLGHPQGRCNCWVLAPSWALNRSIRVRAFAGDEACGEPEEGNHELGSSEPTRRDHSRLSLCSNWMRQPKVLEFPAWKAIPSLGSPVVDVGNASCEILRCTQAGAGPKNAQADGTCCFLAKLWRQLQVFKDALVDATAERPNTCFKVQSLEYEYSIYIYMYVCICI